MNAANALEHLSMQSVLCVLVENHCMKTVAIKLLWIVVDSIECVPALLFNYLQYACIYIYTTPVVEIKSATLWYITDIPRQTVVYN